jgi:anti-sigma regulatory factor (Ser/Thr protein kinase)
MEDLSLHILDIVENATRAGATRVEIHIREDSAEDRLEIHIRDNGRGMDAQMAKRARDPFGTTRTTRRVGLGLPLLEQSARETGGELKLTSRPNVGTEVTATFQASHIDRKPLGDIGATLVSLILGNPDVEFLCELVQDGETTTLDTSSLKAELEGMSITEPAVLALIKDLFKSSGETPGASRAADRASDGGEENG